MKAIDLHIHTKASISDTYFDFDINVLKSYVEILKLNVIAITNHNLFDRAQFQEIIDNINIDVLPGIEVDLENGHMLVISPLEKIDEFEQECNEVFNLIKTANDSLTLTQFQDIFKNYRNYLLIPHYKKSPVIKDSILQALKKDIFVGEVGNPKKFEVTKKDKDALVPVLFSDERIKSGLTNFKIRITYIKIDDVNISNLKIALSDRNNVYTSDTEEEDTFIILEDGTTASTKLNVIMGKRSSGKTYTLKTINKSFEEENIKYIKQFQITSQCEEDEFKAMVERDNSNIVEDYLSEIKKLIPTVIGINALSDDKSITTYITTLKDNASNQSKNNAFSNAKMFNETLFNNVENSELKSLITSIDNIINNEKYKEIISSYIDINKMKELFLELSSIYKKERLEHLIKAKADSIITSIQNKLATKSAIQKIENINFYEIMKHRLIISKFNRIVNKLKEPGKISEAEKDLYRFKINVEKSPFAVASDIQKAIGKKNAIADVFKECYDNSYKFIKKELEQEIPENLLYKTLIKIDMSIKNDNNEEISGGERAEFILLKELEEAHNYDILLIDEPEPSFDNVFLRENVIDKLREISNKTTTFITTHNNSLGITIRPDKIIYTRKNEEGHDVFTTTLTSDLTSKSGEKLAKKSTILDVMEAGSQTYDERSKIYEGFED